MTLFRKLLWLPILLLGLPLLALAQTGDSIGVGATVSGTLTTESLSARYTLQASAGDIITISLESTAFDSYLTLLAPDGRTLATDDDSGGDGNARLSDVALPFTGAYVVVVDSYNQVSTGDYTLSVTGTSSGQPLPSPTFVPTLPPAVEATPTPTPATSGDMQTITAGAPVTGELTAGQSSVIYAYAGRMGEAITITLTSDAFDAYVEIRSADGSFLAGDDDSAGNLNARISDFVLPGDADYQIVVSSYSQTAVGPYTLLVESGGAAAAVTATLPAVTEAAPPTVVPGEADLVYGQTSEGELSQRQTEIEYRFFGRAGDSVTITLSSDNFDAYVLLRDSRGILLTSDDDSAGDFNARISAYTLPADGEYIIVATTYSGTGAGAFTLTLESSSSAALVPTSTPTPPPMSAPTAVPDAVAFIVYGQEVTGEITFEQTSLNYTFAGSAGDVVTITLRSPDFDAFLILLDPLGGQLAADDDGGGDLDAQISGLALPGDGTYTIVAGSFNNASTGSFTLSLASGGAQVEATPVPPTDATPTPTPVAPDRGDNDLAIGETITGTLTFDEPVARYTFFGEAGQRVTITQSSQNFDSFMRLEDPSGFEIASDDDSAGNLNSQIGFFPLPETGVYTIVVDTFDGGTGEFTLSVSAATINPISYGETVTGELTAEQSQAGYVFQGQLGDTISIRLTSEDFDTVVSLIQSGYTGYPLILDDDSAGNGDSLIAVFTLPADGEYLINVRSYDGTGIGSFSLTLEEAQLTPIAYGYSIRTEISADQPGLYYSFEGQAGDVINVTVDSGGSVDTTLALNGPDGFQVMFDDDGGPGFDPEINLLALTQNGTYVLLVRPLATGQSGELTVTLERAPQLSLDDGPQTVSVGQKGSMAVLVFEGTAGETVSLRVRVVDGDSFASPYLNVLQNGELLATSTSSGIMEFTLTVEIPADGAVLVQVSDYNFANVTVEVTLERGEV